MSVVTVTNVDVRKNPAPITEGFELEVHFECLSDLQEDLEWKIIYVGSADDKSYDQELDSAVMGPIVKGSLKFILSTDPPDYTKIPVDDILGFTIILLIGSYRNEEFIRIGWYVHNIYDDVELQENPPDFPILSKIQRLILTDAPRVTRFTISWDNPRVPLLNEMTTDESAIIGKNDEIADFRDPDVNSEDSFEGNDGESMDQNDINCQVNDIIPQNTHYPDGAIFAHNIKHNDSTITVGEDCNHALRTNNMNIPPSQFNIQNRSSAINPDCQNYENVGFHSNLACHTSVAFAGYSHMDGIYANGNPSKVDCADVEMIG